jgi:hypothetical protein
VKGFVGVVMFVGATAPIDAYTVNAAGIENVCESRSGLEGFLGSRADTDSTTTTRIVPRCEQAPAAIARTIGKPFKLH